MTKKHLGQGWLTSCAAHGLRHLSRTVLHKALVFAFAIPGATLCTVFDVQAVPAFPGAQGGGAGSVGGRGGRVIEITSLADDGGPGTLRACVESAVGPRTCVFRVAGEIKLQRNIYVENPFLTVAGQTAPGNILISGKDYTGHLVSIAAHDVIWRYTTLRKGHSDSGRNISGGFNTFARAYNVVFDHNSVSWSEDDLITAWRSGSGVVNSLTYSSNLLAEGLKAQSTGALAGGHSQDYASGMTDIDYVGNLFMNLHHRAPDLVNASSRVVNNLFYNTQGGYTKIGGGAKVDIIGNVYKLGPLSRIAGTAWHHEICAFPESAAYGKVVWGNPSIYLQGNIGFRQPDASGDQWKMTAWQPSKEDGQISGEVPESLRRYSPLPNNFGPIVAQSANGLEEQILPTVGASQHLDCNGHWVNDRDAVDTRLIAQYRTNDGISKVPITENDVGGYPSLSIGGACADSDSDGMPDAYEQAQGLAVRDAGDANLDNNGNGYTNLEEYLAGSTSGATRVAASAPASNNNSSNGATPASPPPVRSTRVAASTGGEACTKVRLNGAQFHHVEGGNSYTVWGPLNANTAADNLDNHSQSMLRVFENDRELGPAHSLHDDIRDYGGGRFSHWSLTNGNAESLRFSASDNSDPNTNGRTYSYCAR